MNRVLRKKSIAIPAVLAGASMPFFGATSHVFALTIIPNFVTTDSKTPSDYTVASDSNFAVIESTINADIATIDSYIANPVTINVTFEELPASNTDGLADSSTGGYYENFSSYTSALQTQQTISPVDSKAIASLGSSTSVNPVNSNSQIFAKESVLTALGYTGLEAPHGFVEFNPKNTFYSRSTPIAGDYDLQSAIAHELDEILGIGGSGSNLNSVALGTSTLADPVGVLDLFRYGAPGTRSYSTDSTATSYFSIDGGNTDLVHFNQAGNGSADYSDWGNGNTTGDQTGNTPSQVQDAFSAPAYDGTNIGDYPSLGPTELTALDAIGWNLTPLGTSVETGAVPEPASISLFAIGAVGLLSRRRRSN